MIHIGKTKKGKFIVANIAKNGEILKVSETLNSKAATWKNIKAELKSCFHPLETFIGVVAVVQDDTFTKPKVYVLNDKRVISSFIPEKKYIPK